MDVVDAFEVAIVTTKPSMTHMDLEPPVGLANVVIPTIWDNIAHLQDNAWQLPASPSAPTGSLAYKTLHLVSAEKSTHLRGTMPKAPHRGTWVLAPENGTHDYVICECGGKYIRTGTPQGARSYKNHIRTQKHLNWLMQSDPKTPEIRIPVTPLQQRPNYAPNQAPHSCTVPGCRGEVIIDLESGPGHSDNY